MIWTQIKAWLFAVGAALFAVLGLTSVYYRKKAKQAGAERDTLQATVRAERERKKIEKKEKKLLEEKREEIKKDIEKKGSHEGLSNPNDW